MIRKDNFYEHDSKSDTWYYVTEYRVFGILCMVLSTELVSRP